MLNIALLLVVAIVGLVCFALRALPRIHKPLLGHDAWAILLTVDQLKKGEGYNGITRYFLLGGDHDYPPLFMYFLSLFPSSWLRRYNWAINPIMDSVNVAVLIFFGNLLTGDLVFSAIAGLIYSFTPVVLEESLILNTRVFGMMLFNVTLVNFVLYQLWNSPVFILCVIAGGILTLLSHKFATEVLFLLFVCFTVTSWSYVPVAVLVVIFLGALAFSGGFYLKILRGQLGINRFWLEHYKDYGARYLVSGVGRKNGRSKSPAEGTGCSGSPVRRLWNRTKKANPLYWLLSLNPFNPFALVVILLPFAGIERMWEWVPLQWSILTLVFFHAATYLRFLGHYPGRAQFLDYNAFPTALLCAVLVWESFSYLRLLVMGVAFLLALIQNVRSWTRIRTYNRSDDQSIMGEIFDYLRRSPKDGVICLPASHTYAVPYFSGKKVFYTMSARNYEKLAAFFPVLTVPVDVLSREYGINFVIVDTMVVAVEALDLNGFKLVMERSGYVLFEKHT